MKDDSIINVLKNLNLTEYESKALMTLFDFSEADAPTISRNSEIPKTRIYDVLDKLKNRGLILEVYKKPKTFKVMDPKQIFKTLLDQKNKEIDNISKKVDQVLLKKNWNTQFMGSKERVLQVNNLKDYNKFLSQEFSMAGKEIIGFTHMDERYDSIKHLENKKDISIKILTKPNTKLYDLPDHINYQEADHSMDAFILDRKKVIMALNDLSTPKKAYHLTVLENNPTLVNALISHFDDYWKK